MPNREPGNTTVMTKLFVHNAWANLKLVEFCEGFNHATEHRAQNSTIITQLGMEPPDMSGWKYMEGSGELRDLGL